MMAAHTHISSVVQCANSSDIEGRFEKKLLRQMEKSLTQSDINRLLEATRHRQAGLLLARAGLEGAAKEIAFARILIDGPSIAEEAQTLGLSFQEPAEAYLAYRMRDYHLASEKLRLALGLLATLYDKYGYAVSARRAHIARNLVVTLRKAGLYDLAGSLIVQLIAWIAQRADWPFCERNTGSECIDLEDDEREVAIDQLVAELGHLAIASSASVDLRTILNTDFPNDPTWRRVCAFLLVVMAHLNGDEEQLTGRASEYRALGCGRLSQLWGIVEELSVRS